MEAYDPSSVPAAAQLREDCDHKVDALGDAAGTLGEAADALGDAADALGEAADALGEVASALSEVINALGEVPGALDAVHEVHMECDHVGCGELEDVDPHVHTYPLYNHLAVIIVHLALNSLFSGHQLQVVDPSLALAAVEEQEVVDPSLAGVEEL